MRNFLKMKTHLTEVAYHLEDVAVADVNRARIYEKITELEKELEQISKSIVSNKFIVNDKFTFIGYYEKNGNPVYSYIGDNYAEDIKSIKCSYEEVMLTMNNINKETNQKLEIEGFETMYNNIVNRMVNSTKNNESLVIEGEIFKVKFSSENFNSEFKSLLNDNINNYYNFKNSKFGKTSVKEGFKVIGNSRIDGLPLISIENSEETLKVKSLKERLEEAFGEEIEEISVVTNPKDHLRKNKQ